MGEVSIRHANAVLERARARFGGQAIDLLMEIYQRAGCKGVFKDPATVGVARAVTYCLYTGVLPDTAGTELQSRIPPPDLDDPSDHFEAVLWRVIQAHPPGLSGGYFGHWRYPPEDSHDP